MKRMYKKQLCACVLTGLVFVANAEPVTAQTETQTLNVRWDKFTNPYAGLGILADAATNTAWNFFMNTGAQSGLVYSSGSPATGLGFSMVGTGHESRYSGDLGLHFWEGSDNFPVLSFMENPFISDKKPDSGHRPTTFEDLGATCL